MHVSKIENSLSQTDTRLNISRLSNLLRRLLASLQPRPPNAHTLTGLSDYLRKDIGLPPNSEQPNYRSYPG